MPFGSAGLLADRHPPHNWFRVQRPHLLERCSTWRPKNYQLLQFHGEAHKIGIHVSRRIMADRFGE